MKVLLIGAAGGNFDLGDDEEGSGDGIDDRRGGDAEFDLDVAGADLGLGDGRGPGWEKGPLPQRRRVMAGGVVVGVKGVHAVVLGGDVDDIM